MPKVRPVVHSGMFHMFHGRGAPHIRGPYIVAEDLLARHNAQYSRLGRVAWKDLGHLEQVQNTILITALGQTAIYLTVYIAHGYVRTWNAAAGDTGVNKSDWLLNSTSRSPLSAPGLSVRKSEVSAMQKRESFGVRLHDNKWW